MADRSILKDFYNKTEEDLESEDDSDFVPDQSDSEDNLENVEDEEDEEDAEKITKTKKRSIEEVAEEEERGENSGSSTEDPSSKKSRLDAIWADMNKPAESNKKTEETVKLETEKKSDENSAATAAAKEKPTRQKKASIIRPKSSLSSLVSQYNIKVPKMNTLEKSKLDWQGYVEREGIQEDLKYKNKDGYMEKVEFLQRVDDRRLSQLKEGQKASKKSKPE